MRDFRIALLVVVLYFGAAYFGAAALIPRYAYEIALVSLIIGLAAYQYLLSTIGEEPSFPYTLLLLAIPVACACAGILWWIMRLVGAWEPIE